MGYFAKYNTNADFMNGREKGQLCDVTGKPLHIENYQIMKSDRGDYVALTFKEIDKFFYFGNSILLDIVRGTEQDGMQDLLFTTPVVVTKQKNKTNTFDYWKWEFIED